MKRLCIFAHWDRDNIVDDYVLYYLRALKEVCTCIVFVSDCNLPSEEQNKLSNLADFVIAEKHGEYDFGSYKRGYLLAKEKNLDFEELLFVNDSCYGPFFPLKPIFEKMEKKKCDWWGLTSNRYGIQRKNSRLQVSITPHIQSYFLLFKPNVFNSNIFREFLESIKHLDNKEDVVINYEQALSSLLNKYKSATYINKYRFCNNCTLKKWKQLIIKDKFPFLKTSICKNGLLVYGEIKNWEKIINSKTDYPVDLIKNNSKRLINLHPDTYSQMKFYDKLQFKLSESMPVEILKALNFIKKLIIIKKG